MPSVTALLHFCDEYRIEGEERDALRALPLDVLQDVIWAVAEQRRRIKEVAEAAAAAAAIRLAAAEAAGGPPVLMPVVELTRHLAVYGPFAAELSWLLADSPHLRGLEEEARYHVRSFGAAAEASASADWPVNPRWPIGLGDRSRSSSSSHCRSRSRSSSRRAVPAAEASPPPRRLHSSFGPPSALAPAPSHQCWLAEGLTSAPRGGPAARFRTAYLAGRGSREAYAAGEPTDDLRPRGMPPGGVFVVLAYPGDQPLAPFWTRSADLGGVLATDRCCLGGYFSTEREALAFCLGTGFPGLPERRC